VPVIHIILNEDTNSLKYSFVVVMASGRLVSTVRVVMAESSTKDLEALQAGVKGFVLGL